MTPPPYEGPASKVLERSGKTSQTFSKAANSVEQERFFTFGPYRLDCERRLLLRGDDPVPLYEKALEILIVLVRHRGEIVSKDELMKAVWPDAFVEEANLSQNVFVLRKTLGERPKENRYIATIPGRGYSFVAVVEQPVPTDVIPVTPAGDRVHAISAKIGPQSRTVSSIRPNRTLLIALVAGLAVAAALVTSAYLGTPKLARYFNNEGVLRQQQGNIRAAISSFHWAIRFNSNYVEAHYNLGDAYEEIPDYVRAAEEYQRAIDIDQTFYPAYNNLSRLYILRLKEYGTAMRLLDRALSFEPKETPVRYTLYKNYGWANFQLGQLGQAEQNLHIAINLDPERGSAHCLLAKVLGGQSRVSDAVPEWESCLGYSNQPEVEPDWRNSAQEALRARQAASGGVK